MTVRCRVGDVVRRGEAIRLGESVDPDELVRAVRAEPDRRARLSVAADEPGPAHEHVGCLRPGMSLRRRTALAAAARSCDLESPHDETLESARERVESLETPSETTDRSRLRRELAEATRETERLREEVATQRGRVVARRENGLDAAAAEAEHRAAVTRLSEVRTEMAAAKQRLEEARERAREHRDSHERRFRQAKRVANLERRARAYLADRLEPAYERSLTSLTAGRPELAKRPDPDRTAAQGLAVARVANLSAPVVVSGGWFESPAAAADWLGCPVLRI